MGEMSDYQDVFRNAPAALMLLDPDLMIVDASDAYLAVTMRDRDELVGRPVFEAFPDNPDDLKASGVAKLGASLGRVLREQVVDVMDILKYDIARPGGGYDVRYWSPVNAPVFGPDGRLRWIVHRAEDVTSYVHGSGDLETTLLNERVSAETHARRRFQERTGALQAVMDSLEAAVVATDADGRPVLHNAAARTLLGDDIANLDTEQWGRLLCHADGNPVGAGLPLLRALRGERVQDAEVIHRVTGRPQRVFRVHGNPITGQPGVAAVVAIHEVTLARRAAKFQECELAVARVIGEPEADERVLSEAVRLIGTLIGWDLVEFFICDDTTELLDLAGRWPHSDDPPREDLPRRAWQTKRPVYLPDLAPDRAPLRTAIAVPVPVGPHTLGVLVCYSEVVEIPEDVRAETVTGIAPPLGVFLARRRAERLSTALDHARDQYISLVGHELRTPLTSIQSYTDMLLDEEGLTGDQRHMLTVVQRNATGLRGIVLKLLDVASLRAGQLDVHTRPMDLAGVVREAAGAHAVHAEVPETAPIIGDPERLRQVLDELLSNALTWADDPSTVRVRAEGGEHTVTVSVCNTGVPIRPEERAHLFELFYRGADARRQGIPGAGLGLSLACAIIEQHGGSITVGEAGETTTFTLRLPTSRRRTVDQTATRPRPSLLAW